MKRHPRPRSRRVPNTVSALFVAAAMTMTYASCAAGGASGSDDVAITVLVDKTGKAAFFGSATATAAEFSAKYINDNGGMGGKKVKVTIKDTGSDPATASASMNQAVSQDADAVIFGVLTEEALAIAPLAQDAGLPMVNVQAGGDGVTDVGDHIWRITPQQAVFYPGYAEYLATEKRVKSAAVFYVTDNAPSTELATEVLPKTFGDVGIEVTNSVASSSTETDLTNAVSKLMAGNPDMIQTHAIGAQNVTLITQLRRAGYEGLIGGGTALGAGALTDVPADQSNGIVYYSSFVGSSDLPFASGKEFNDAFEAATGEQPNTFHAETFDAFSLIAKAIDESDGEVSREAIQSGMEAVAESGGFDGAQAAPLTFDDNRDAQGPGIVIQWEDGRETLAPGQ